MKARHLFLLPIAVLLVAIIAAVIVIATVDVNKFKPHIQKVAKTQAQLDLQIDGDLGWRFWPSIGVNIGKTQARLLNQGNDSTPFAAVDSFALDVAVMPLLKGQLDIKGLDLDGLSLNLAIDKQGTGNWTHIGKAGGKADSNADAQTSAGADSDIALSLNSLNINDATINYSDARNQTAQSVTIHSLHGEGINTKGQPFALELDLSASQSEGSDKRTLSVENRTKATVRFDSNKQVLQLIDAESKLNASVPAIPEALKLNLQHMLTYHLDSGELNIDQLSVGNASTNIRFQGKAQLPQTDQQVLTASGPLTVSISELKKQLRQLGVAIDEPSNSKLLQSLSLNSQLSVKGDAIALNQLKGSLDDTALRGQLSFKNGTVPKIDADLTLTELDVDGYLPAKTDVKPGTGAAKTGDTASATATTSTGDEPFSLDAIQSIDSRIALRADKLITNGLLFETLVLNTSTQNGVLNIKPFEANFYGGKIQLSSQVDSRSKPAKFDIKPNINTVQLAPLLEALEMDLGLSGTANINANVNMRGNTVNALKQSLSGSTKVAISNGEYSKSNLEKLVCQGIALARNETLGNQWAAGTTFQTLSTDITWLNGNGNITQFVGGLENLKLDATGIIALPNSRYDIKLGANISGDIQEKDPACQINERYRNIRWPLHCHGSGDKNSCGLDEKALKRALTDAAKEKAKAKIEQKVEKEIDRKLKEKLGEGVNDALKEGLRGLFK